MEALFTSIKTIPIEHCVILSFTIFTIGMLGVFIRRNALVVLLCIELMLNAVNFLLVAFSVYYNNPHGQILVFFVMALAAAEAAIGLAIVVMVHRNQHTINIGDLNRLKK